MASLDDDEPAPYSSSTSTSASSSSASSPSSSSSPIVSLNVGGKLYQTLRSTISKYPDSLLNLILSSKVPAEIDANGAYFIDRDPSYFDIIIDYYIRNKINYDITKGKSPKRIIEELHYFGFLNIKEEDLVPGAPKIVVSAEKVYSYRNRYDSRRYDHNLYTYLINNKYSIRVNSFDKTVHDKCKCGSVHTDSKSTISLISDNCSRIYDFNPLYDSAYGSPSYKAFSQYKHEIQVFCKLSEMDMRDLLTYVCDLRD